METEELVILEHYKYKGGDSVASRLSINKVYTPVRFINFKWSDIKVHFTVISLEDEGDNLQSYINAQSLVSKAQNLNEYVFNSLCDQTGVIAILSNRYRSGEISTLVTKMYLNDTYVLSSEEIFEAYRSSCIFSHLCDPRKGVDLSYSPKGKDKTLNIDKNLLTLSYTSGQDAKK